MEAASVSRKDKLAALRKRKADEEAGLITPGTTRLKFDTNSHLTANLNANGDDGEDELDVELRKQKEGQENRLKERRHRNYDTETGQMRLGGVGGQDTVELATVDLQSQVLEADSIARSTELDLTNIAPRKPNWDLKRDMERRLKKLARRDEECRLILLRQRITSQKAQSQSQSATGTGTGELTAAQAEIAASALLEGSGNGTGGVGDRGEDGEGSDEDDGE